MMENNELIPVLECRQPAVVVDNLIDLQQRIVEVETTVANLPHIRESLPAARKARAELNKYFATLETQRKLVKAMVMQPYTDAEKRYKELVSAPIKQALCRCDEFVEGIENEAKARCENELREYFTELCQAKGIFWLKFERVGIKVTLAMADQKELKKPRERIREFVQRVDNDLQTITGMENSAEILTEYERTLDVSTAISAVQNRRRAQEIAEENRSKWQEQQNARMQNAAHIATSAPEKARVIQESQVKRYTATFAVTDTVSRLRGLKAFLDGNNYEYQEVND